MHRQVHFGPPSVTSSGAAEARHDTLGSMLGNMRKHGPEVTIILGCFVALGLLYALTSTPLFTATTEILIDARLSHVSEGSGGNRSLAELGMDPASIDSQAAVLGSEKIGAEALRQLHLDHDIEFISPSTLPGRILQGVRHLLGRDRRDTAGADVPADILEGFMKSLDVKRVQQTYLLSLSFSARDPERAAAIVNTMARIYIEDQVKAALESRKVNVAWLKDRVSGLRNEIAAAEASIRSFDAEVKAGFAPVGVAPEAVTPMRREHLRALQRDLDDKRMLYAALMQRANASVQQQSMPVSDASVLRPARVPERRSQPNMLLILALSLLSGLAAAVGYVSWREMTDKTFRVPSQVETDLALPFLGCFPRTARTRRRGSRSQGARARFFGRRSVGGEAGATCSEDPYDRAALAAIRDATRQAANVPASPVIGIISALPGEGRSSVARRLARFFSQGEQRALIIDADVSPRLSKLPVQSGTGATSHEVTTDIDVVAASVPVEHTPAWIADSVAIARQRYAATVIDMPPLTDTTDLSVFGTVDVVVLVIAWGRTDRAMVAEALQALPVASDRIIGVVLNDVDTPRLRRLARDPRDRFHLARSLRRHALSH